MRQLVKWIIWFPLMLYAALLLFGWFGSEGMIFVPPAATYRDGEKILKLTTDDGAKISAMFFANPSARFTILFSHGNAEDLGTVRWYLKELCDTGFNVLGFDYRGYGTSEGSPSERNCYGDVDAAYRHLTEVLGVAPSNIIVMGRSVGSGPSVDLASRKPVGGLVIQSGFVSAFRVMTHAKIVPFDRFDNLSKMPKVKCPVLILHGTADTIIPSWHGQKLYDAALSPKQIFLVPGADHNDFNEVAGPRLFEALSVFAASLNVTVRGELPK